MPSPKIYSLISKTHQVQFLVLFTHTNKQKKPKLFSHSTLEKSLNPINQILSMETRTGVMLDDDDGQYNNKERYLARVGLGHSLFRWSNLRGWIMTLRSFSAVGGLFVDSLPTPSLWNIIINSVITGPPFSSIVLFFLDFFLSLF